MFVCLPPGVFKEFFEASYRISDLRLEEFFLSNDRTLGGGLVHSVLGSYPSQDRLSLQNAKDGPGKLERILPSMNFRVSFLRIHPKETQKSIDPTKAKCWKLVQQSKTTTWKLDPQLFEI